MLRLIGLKVFVKNITLRLSLSKASFKLNILRLSRMFAALRCAIVATLRLDFLDEFGAELPLLGDKR